MKYSKILSNIFLMAPKQKLISRLCGHQIKYKMKLGNINLQISVNEIAFRAAQACDKKIKVVPTNV